MSDLYIDFETYSACDIKKKGGYAYAVHPSTQIICLGYTFDDEQAELATPAEPLPKRIVDHVTSGQRVYAHNATFDYRIWNGVGVNDLAYPALSLDQMVDTMALCLTFQLPPSLADAGEALGIRLQKQKEGTALIKMCCVPQKNGQQPTPWGTNARAFSKLYEYCRRDVEAMREIVQTLPRKELIPTEQRIWELTYKMNTTGIPVDYKAIVCIRDYLNAYVARELKRVPKMCGNAFSTLGQLQKIRDWCGQQGYALATLDANTVQVALNDPNCPDNVRAILEMRQEFGRSSTAKYTKLADLAVLHDDGQYYVHDNLQYHGAGPGRWAGRGFQVHNLPRASVPNPEECINQFLEAMI